MPIGGPPGARKGASSPVLVSWIRISRTAAEPYARQSGNDFARKVRGRSRRMSDERRTLPNMVRPTPPEREGDQPTRGIRSRIVDAGTSAAAGRQQAIDRAFRSMPERFLGADPGFRATYRIVLADIGRTWEVKVTPEAVRVRRDGTQREPDVTIGTDAATWLALREGELSGVEAFRRRLLYARGNLDQAIAFEGLFRLPGGRMPLSRVCEVPVGRH